MIFDLSINGIFYQANKYLWKLSQENKLIEINEYKDKRSNQQNKRYWAILKFIEDETGEDKTRLHLLFREMFLEHVQVDVFGRKIIEIQSTTELNTKQFFDYCEKIRIFVNTELNLTIPEMDSDDFNSFVEHYSKFI